MISYDNDRKYAAAEWPAPEHQRRHSTAGQMTKRDFPGTDRLRGGLTRRRVVDYCRMTAAL
jgi:hypothetical protein